MRKPTSDAMAGRSLLSRRHVWRATLLMTMVGRLVLPTAWGQDAPDPAQERAIARIHELGGRITRDETKPGKPVIFVTLTGSSVTDADLALLTTMRDLKVLTLTGTKISGEGLDLLVGMTN